MMVGLLMVVAIVAGILTARSEGKSIPKTRSEWARTIGYWVLTIAVAFEMVAGGIWDVLRIEFVRVSLTRLGYPLYLLYILGPPEFVWRLRCLFLDFRGLRSGPMRVRSSTTWAQLLHCC